jgi:hypothetical protein
MMRLTLRGRLFVAVAVLTLLVLALGGTLVRLGPAFASRSSEGWKMPMVRATLITAS